MSTSKAARLALWWNERLAEAYRADLWDAADIMIGDCSDDVFEDFRAWLVLQGKSTYEATLLDADAALSGAAAVEAEQVAEAEGVADVIASTYEIVTGDALPDTTPDQLDGTRGDAERAARRARFPLLAAAYPKRPDTIRFPWRDA